MDQAVDSLDTTHTQRKVTAAEVEALADRVFVAGLQTRRADLLLCSALLRRLSLDGDVEELYVWRLDGEAE